MFGSLNYFLVRHYLRDTLGRIGLKGCYVGLNYFFFLNEKQTHTRKRESNSNIKTYHKLHLKVMITFKIKD